MMKHSNYYHICLLVHLNMLNLLVLLIRDISVKVAASPAFVKIELSPDNIEIDIPANINNTIMFTTNAIKVIPLISSFFLCLCFFHSFPPFKI